MKRKGRSYEKRETALAIMPEARAKGAFSFERGQQLKAFSYLIPPRPGCYRGAGSCYAFLLA